MAKEEEIICLMKNHKEYEVMNILRDKNICLIKNHKERHDLNIILGKKKHLIINLVLVMNIKKNSKNFNNICNQTSKKKFMIDN